MPPISDILEQIRTRLASARCLPESTYRIQFHGGFTFRDATAIVPYLRHLGITHCYASPYLTARSGSTHGYDIVDHNSLNPEIGTGADYDALVATLQKNGLGQIADIVPNHMGVGTNDNAWWNDVLENGPASRYASHFDIAWRASPRPELQNKVLLPVLGEPYGDALETGQLRLTFANGGFAIHYYDRHFPVAARSYPSILGYRLEQVKPALGEEAAWIEYQSILTGARNLPDQTESDPGRVAERGRETEVIKRRLGVLADESESVRSFIAENVALFNGSPGNIRSFDLLDALLEVQCYRLCLWRVASDEINYRRFFDINDLAALDMARPEVFEAAHALIIRLLAHGKINGLRIDHADGLYDPAEYFRRLQEQFALALARQVVETDPAFRSTEWHEVEQIVRDYVTATWFTPGAGSRQWPLYVVVEKILGADETLVDTWAVDGTSGYDFITMVNGLFVDTRNAGAFTRLYAELTQEDGRFSEVAYHKKGLILNVSLSSELHMLTHQLDRLAQKNRASRDFTFNTLRAALREVVACFPVYRSYITEDGITAADRRCVDTAVHRAIARNPLMSGRVFRFIRNMLLLDSPEAFTAEDRADQRRLAGTFQQVTAPVTAKGIEDTAFYVYNRLISLNEVGAEPGRFGVSPDTLHRYNTDRQARWPYALSPLSTHDTKRSEDVRARINVLSELPDEWHACVVRWSRLNAPHRIEVEDRVAPDSNEEYLLYQTLLGAWPLEPYTREQYAAFVERIQAYMEKALHEAKVHTSWINPNDTYDTAVRAFVSRILNAETNRAFVDDFLPFQRRISQYGLFNSLSQTLLKATCPGVPDTYQGTEVWDFSLVDPDNRRPVDYVHRQRELHQLQRAFKVDVDPRGLARQLVSAKEDGRIKLYVTYRSLQCRRDHPGLFSAGEYWSLMSSGERAEHVFAFARRTGEALAIVAVPRLLTRLVPDATQPPLGPDVWRDTRLELTGLAASVEWQNIFTGEALAATQHGGSLSLTAADIFKDFPIALLLGRYLI